MSKANIYLKIYYTEPDSEPKKILAEVNKNQLYSLKNYWVDVINYNHKAINKYDITKIKPLEEDGEITLSQIRTEIYLPLKARALGV
ncbi:hypothetical protein LCGC14_0987110 [marine sediment metagenome]|uniref:Uncharacterized protein n=1 Tax=marine sediment metagenome TaxID=412755 RepID=A0A0F9QQC4_9ZZZZ